LDLERSCGFLPNTTVLYLGDYVRDPRITFLSLSGPPGQTTLLSDQHLWIRVCKLHYSKRHAEYQIFAEYKRKV